jgi:hypothetical protein
MGLCMRWLRITALVSVASILLALAVYWSQQRIGFATPTACLDGYREASLAGDVEEYRSCLAEPLRADIQRHHPDPKELAESLRQELKDLKTWVQLPDPASEGSKVQVDVDEVRIDGIRRIRFHLQRFSNGWLIAAIDRPKIVPSGIPYGTHISKVPEQSEPAPRP